MTRSAGITTASAAISSEPPTTKPKRRSAEGCKRVPAGEQSDAAELGPRLAAGDDSVIGELYRTYGGRIMSLALRVLNDRQLAEQVVQETILRVWRQHQRFDATQDLEPWLFRVARGRIRVREPRTQWGDPASTLESLTATDNGDDPVITPEALALQWDVRAAIDALTETDREVVRLQHLCGLSHREIAARLGISVGMVTSRSHRAHRKLATLSSDQAY